MFCRNCGNQLADGVRFCPYCGTDLGETAPVYPPQSQAPVYGQPAQAQQPASEYQPSQQPYTAPQQPYGQQVPPEYNPYNPGYYTQPPRADDGAVQSTKTLGLVALIVGLFIPLVGYICGGIGLSRIRKLEFFADPMQKEQLAKNKTLCILGIVIPAAINIGLVIFNLIVNA